MEQPIILGTDFVNNFNISFLKIKLTIQRLNKYNNTFKQHFIHLDSIKIFLNPKINLNNNNGIFYYIPFLSQFFVFHKDINKNINEKGNVELIVLSFDEFKKVFQLPEDIKASEDKHYLATLLQKKIKFIDFLFNNSKKFLCSQDESIKILEKYEEIEYENCQSFDMFVSSCQERAVYYYFIKDIFFKILKQKLSTYKKSYEDKEIFIIILNQDGELKTTIGLLVSIKGNVFEFFLPRYNIYISQEIYSEKIFFEKYRLIVNSDYSTSVSKNPLGNVELSKIISKVKTLSNFDFDFDFSLSFENYVRYYNILIKNFQDDLIIFNDNPRIKKYYPDIERIKELKEEYEKKMFEIIKLLEEEIKYLFFKMIVGNSEKDFKIILDSSEVMAVDDSNINSKAIQVPNKQYISKKNPKNRTLEKHYEDEEKEIEIEFQPIINVEPYNSVPKEKKKSIVQKFKSLIKKPSVEKPKYVFKSYSSSSKKKSQPKPSPIQQNKPSQQRNKSKNITSRLLSILPSRFTRKTTRRNTVVPQE